MTTKKSTVPLRDHKFVMKLDDGFILCRSMRHSWEPVKVGLAKDVLDADQIAMGYSTAMVRILQCIRCEMFRFDFLTNGGRRPARLEGTDAYSIFYRRYVPPDGYGWTSNDGVERPEMRDYHQEFFRRNRSDR